MLLSDLQVLFLKHRCSENVNKPVTDMSITLSCLQTCSQVWTKKRKKKNKNVHKLFYTNFTNMSTNLSTDLSTYLSKSLPTNLDNKPVHKSGLKPLPHSVWILLSQVTPEVAISTSRQRPGAGWTDSNYCSNYWGQLTINDTGAADKGKTQSRMNSKNSFTREQWNWLLMQ